MEVEAGRGIEAAASGQRLWVNELSAIEKMMKAINEAPSNDSRATVVMDYLKQWVPVLYRDVDIVQKYKVEKMLLSPLKHLYICGGNSTTVLQNDVAAFCTREFRHYEKAYICEDCDKTQKSFICVDCFKNSPHKDHKYRMMFLKHGGVCCCGIPGLQNSSFSCKMHTNLPINAGDAASSLEGTKRGNVGSAETVSCVENIQQHADTNAQTLAEDAQNILECEISDQERSQKDALFTLLSYILEASQNPWGWERNANMVDLNEADCTLSKFTNAENVVQENTFCVVLQRTCADYNIYQENSIIHVLCNTGCTTVEQKLCHMEASGRALVRTGAFKDCCILADNIRFPDKAFECVVLNSTTLSHQTFAMHLLRWLKQLICHSSKLRRAFTRAVFQTVEDGSPVMLIDQIFTSSSRLWSHARHCTEHLLTQCLIFNTQVKIQFIKAFMRNAKNIVAHIKIVDEGSSVLFEHLISRMIAVDSNALKSALVEKHDALSLLFRIFFQANVNGFCMGQAAAGECTFCSRAGNKLTHAVYLARTMITFLLQNRVGIWTQEIRTNFVKAFRVFLNILGIIQCASRIFANATQNWVYFTNPLCMKYYESIRLLMGYMCSWTVSDPTTYTECLTLMFEKMRNYPPIGLVAAVKSAVTIDNHTALCFIHDNRNNIHCSHLPFSLLYFKIMQAKLAHDAHFVFPANSEQLLNMVYQALEPLFFIREMNKKTMLRKMPEGVTYGRHCKIINNAIPILQMGASIMDSNEFLIHVINRLHLVPWMKNLPPAVGQEVGSDLQLLLSILLAVVAERWAPYIGENITVKTSVQHEVVQMLGLKRMTYSDMCKHLWYKNKQIEEVLQQVATVDKQTDSELFVLKPEFTSECNIFYYHFDRNRQAEAKRSQLVRLTQNKQSSQMCTPPLPPKFTPQFAKVAQLLYCDVMLKTINVILSKACLVDEDTVVSESVLEQTLFLIGYALMEEETSSQSSEICFTQQAVTLKQLLVNMLALPHLKLQAELISWLLDKWNAILKGRNANQDSSLEQQPCVKKAKTSQSCEDNREATNKFLQQMQASVMNANMLPASFAMDLTADDVEQLPAPIVDKTEAPVCLGPNHSKATPYDARYTCIICLCPDVRSCSPESKNVVMPALVQHSTVLCRDRKLLEAATKVHQSTVISGSKKLLKAETDNAAISTQHSLILSSNLGPAPHTSSCGHKMHTECFKNLKDIETDKETTKLLAPFILKSEFLCPLCNTISNAVLPVFPAVDDMVQYLPHEATVAVSFDNWYLALKIIHKGLESPHINPMDLAKCSQSTIKWLPSSQTEMLSSLTPESQAQISKLFPEEDARNVQCTDNMFALSFQISDDNEAFCNLLAKISVSERIESQDLQVILTIASVWKTCAYTIHGVERVQRSANQSLLGHFSERQAETLRSIILAPMFIYIHDKVMSCVAQNLYGTLIQMNNDICILDWDPFGLLVALTSTSPFLLHNYISSLPACGTKEQRTLHIVLLSHIVCLMLGTTWDEEQTDEEESSEGVEALQMLKLVYKSARLPTPQSWPAPRVLWNKIKADCIPFLRCCAIYFHFLTGVVAPQSLTQSGGDTFYELTRYLGLPDSCSELLGPKSASLLVMSWTSHPKVCALVKSNNFIHGALQVNQLIPLPSMYCDLFNCELTSAVFADSKRTVLCLVCGQWVNFKAHVLYAKRGEWDVKGFSSSMYHAYQCGMNTGLFLNVLECQLYILRVPNQGTYYCVPYEDRHGETDPELKKGVPTFFKPEIYETLQRLWLSHELLRNIPLNPKKNRLIPQPTIDWSKF